MNVKRIILFFVAALGILTSCVENLNEPNDVNNLLSGVEAQVEAMQKSAEDMKALNEALSEFDVDINEAVETVNKHVASLTKGSSLEAAALATLEQQKAIATVVGAAEGAVLLTDEYAKKLKPLFDEVHTGVSIWLGETFSAYYPVVVAQAKADAVLGDLNPQIEDQQMYVDALMSDVEAGLRKDENPAELTELAASVKKVSQDSETLATDLASLAEEVEAEYKAAMKSMFSSQASLDNEAIVELNASVMTKARASTPTLVELAASVKACESTLEALQQRLGDVEADINELLAMIQSLTFVSEYSDEKAVAYYTMTDQLNNNRAGEGKKERVPEDSFNLSFLVRPASAATALAETWQESLKVVGYYAERVQQQAQVNLLDNFNIENVVLTPGKGMLTITVENNFDEQFYFKEKGAMLALSVESGKNNCTSKFVEIVPRDKSGKVYAESFTLEPSELSIQKGDTYLLKPVITPANVTDKGYNWISTSYFTVDEYGRLSATAEGTANLEVETVATDEFGRHLTATCEVTVTPAITISGPIAVELGQTVELRLESPTYIDPSQVRWSVDPLFRARVDLEQDGINCKVTGKMIYHDTETIHNYHPETGEDMGTVELPARYKEFNLICEIDGVTTIYYPFRSVALQPKALAINGVDANANRISVKIGEQKDYSAMIIPVAVTLNNDYFRVTYRSNDSAVASIDFSSGILNANAYGSCVIDFTAASSLSKNYCWPTDYEYKRQVTVDVEPYWVKTMAIPPTYKMAPDDRVILPVDWTSDVIDKLPSDQTLVWTSSDPSIVQVVNASTGEIRALAEGIATITATTAGSNSVQNGSHLSSECLVSVETPTIPINVGDFYYSDGTWSSELQSGKKVIGVVFAKYDATAEDSYLRRDYPKCSNGLVVGIKGYRSIYGEFSMYYMYDWTGSNYPELGNLNLVNGYYNTLGHEAYRVAKYSNGLQLYNSSSGVVAQQNAEATSPASSWYIPSYKEACFIYQNLSKINAALAKVSGANQIGTSETYYISTLWSSKVHNGTSYTDYYPYPFSMSTGTATQDNSANKYETEHPVRVVLAF